MVILSRMTNALSKHWGRATASALFTTQLAFEFLREVRGCARAEQPDAC